MQPKPTYPFWVVGIGASAGGLESLERFFAKAHVASGMAYVVVQHLSPDFKSVMDELLARQTNISIRQAQEDLLLEPDTIYLIPPRKEAILSGGRFHLTDKEPKEPLSLPIDHFFRSLAADVGARAIAVVLSGSGSDGSRGIRDVHQAGGLVLCESEETAKFDGMPLSARDTGIVDFVLAPEDMPATISQYVSANPADAGDTSDEPIDKSTETIFRLLNDEYGIDFSHYKSSTVGRRIERRLGLRQFDNVEDYAEHLRNDPAELNSLYKDLLIGVTRFFRDADAFARLEHDIIPHVIDSAATGREIRVWVAGCATGEEAYSIAMLLHERLEKTGREANVKVFATDVHRASLDFASAAVYSEEAINQVSPERLTRYFTRAKEGYHVDPELRKLVVFAPHNVLRDAPFTKIDLIACRNLLIYFQPLAQKKALSVFHFGLRTGGILMLGPSESPGELLDEFETLDEHWKIFRKRRDVRLPADMRYPLHRAAAQLLKNAPRSVLTPPVRGLPDPSLIGAYDWLLGQNMPPALLIDDRNELLHIFGGAEKYLKIRPGRPSNDALDYLEGDLRAAVFGALQRAKKEPTPVAYRGVRLADQQGETCSVIVQRIINPRANRQQFLVKFEPVPQPSHAAEQASADTDHRRISRDRIETLEGELRYAKENLQATVEELETSNEELQATNEELVASNEELQSTNEELHSVNEELYTVNAEYQKKINDLTEMTNDMDNLMESTDVATVFLDNDLCIRKFTPQIAPIFNLVPHDLGRSIDNFSHHLTRDNLYDDLRQVLKTGQPIEAEVQDRQERWKFLRILPYHAKKQVQGVVLTLIDINSLKQTQESLALAVKHRETFLATLSHELRNPLSALLNATNLLESATDAEAAGLAVGVVRRQARHIARLLDDLLDVSRITQSKFELRHQLFDVRSAVEAAIETMRPAASDKGHQIKLEIWSEPLIVNGDPDRLRQVQVNLLDNAIKYSPAGGEICIQATRESDTAVIRVSDCGEGLTAETIAHIFEPFFQAGRPRGHRLGGMGLGLSLVRLIVEQHGGDVQVRSDGINQGSEFTILLPLAASLDEHQPSDRQPLDQRTKSDGHNGNGKPHGRKIVLVEDQADNRKMLTRWLQLKGHTVQSAPDGLAGVALIEREQPEVALVDIGLPKIDGYEVARRVRAGKSSTIKLVALTGYGQPADVEAALQAGFDHHLVKPVNPDDLERLLAGDGHSTALS